MKRWALGITAWLVISVVGNIAVPGFAYLWGTLTGWALWLGGIAAIVFYAGRGVVRVVRKAVGR